MTDVVTVVDQDTLVVQEQVSATVEIANDETLAIKEEVLTVVSVGTQGPPGSLIAGGYGFEAVQAPKTGDVIMFTGSAWGNTHQSNISDGGNF